MPPFEAAGITPQALVRALWKQRACWALLWLLATAVVLAAVWSLPRRYKAEAILAVDPVRPPGRGAAIPSDTTLRAQLHLTRLRVLQRERLLELLRQSWPELVAGWKPADALRHVEELRGRITVSTLPESRGAFVAVRVVFEAADPARGAAVTNRVASELVQEFERLSQPPSAAPGSNEINAARARMSECQAALAAFEQEHGSDLEAREKATLTRLAYLRADLAANAQALHSAQREAVRIEQALAQASPAAGAPPAKHAPRERPPAEPATVRQLRERLALLRARYKDSHPDVRRAREELLQAETLVVAGLSTEEVPAESGSDPDPLDSQRRRLRAELEETRRRALELEQETVRLQGEIAAERQALEACNDLRRQHEALRRECEVTEAAYRAAAARPPESPPARASVRLVVLEQALPKGKANRPNRRLLAILGAVIALLPCGAVAAGREIGVGPILTLLGLAPPVSAPNGRPAVEAAAVASNMNGRRAPQAG